MGRKSGFLISYILVFVNMSTSIMLTPILVRSLGEEQFGLFSLVSSITAYLLLLDLGVGNATVKYMSKYRVLNDVQRQRQFLGTTMLFYLGIGVLAVLLGVCLQNVLPSLFGHGLNHVELQKTKVMFGITMINAALTLIISPFDRIITAFERYVFSQFMLILQTVLRVVWSIFALLAGGNAIDIVRINLFVTILYGLTISTFVFFKLKVNPRINGIEKSFIKEVMGYSGIVFIQMIATQINSMADKVLLGAMVSTLVVAVYSIGSQIAQYFQSIAGSINGVLMPGVVRLVESGASPSKLLDEMVRIGRFKFSYLSIIWAAFALFGQQFVELWVGRANASSYWVSLLLIFPMLLMQTQSIGTYILWAMGKHKIQAYLQIIVAVLNIGITATLIKWNPLLGAAVGTFTALTVGDVVVMNIVFTKFLCISMKEYYARLCRGILPSLILASIIGGLIRLIDFSGWMGFIVNCGIMCTAYLVVMWFYGLARDEKRLLKSFLGRVSNAKIRQIGENRV